MNHFLDECTAEYNRQRILEETALIRLEHQAQPRRVGQPRLIERTMFKVADWMISTGKRLRQKYEMRSVEGNQRPSGNFAR